MNYQPDVFDLYTSFFEIRRQTEFSLREYLNLCREEPTTFATAAERMVAAIGEPEVIDTAQDTRLGRIFMNRSIKRYPAFADFYGMEETIERIVASSSTPPRAWRSASRSSTFSVPSAAVSRRWPSASSS